MKEKLANARQEVKDYELYKDVMETAVVRLKGEMQRLVDEREAAKKAASRASAHARREREQANAARKRAKAAEGDLVQLQLSTEDQVSRVKASFRQKEVGGVATHGRDGDSCGRWGGGVAHPSCMRPACDCGVQNKLLSMRDQALADNERLLRELERARERLAHVER